MKIAILGYAGQGQAAYEYWDRDGNELTICDKNESLQAPVKARLQLGPDYLKNLESFDLLVRTPALHPRNIVEANPQSPQILDKVTTVTNEFLRVCPSANIIGVTGTKGKGTTSTLIAEMLQADGKRVHLGGNIGIPPLNMLKDDIKPEDWVVLELANFQLIDLKQSPHIAVCLQVVPEHQDWHTDFEEYMTAKQQLFRWQSAEDVAIYYESNENSKRIAGISKGKHIPYLHAPGAEVIDDQMVIDGLVVCKISEVKLLGKHNWQNICAAITAVWQVTQNINAIRSVVTGFAGLPYRIEQRREVNGIKFYNDSFATGPDATIAAIEAITEKKVIILGGFDRGLSLERLADTLKQHEADVRRVVLIGASAERLGETLESKGFLGYEHEPSRDTNVIVRRAAGFAHSGDAVLFSPGFASFDMFKNFEERGQKFNEAVEQL